MKWTTSCASAASKVPIGERQLLGGSLPDVDTGQPLAGCRHKRIGRIYGADQRAALPAYELGSQHTGSAAHVERGLASGQASQVGERLREWF